MPSLPTRQLGRADLQVPILGLGGAPLGDLFERIPEPRALATVERAYELGARLYDTAPLYGYGLSEHRMGHVLRQKPRDSYVLSTKVGRLLIPEDPARIDRGIFQGGLNFRPEYDYSYDGTLRVVEQSLQRLGIERIDVSLIHDVDIWTHGSRESYEARLDEAIKGAYRALDRLRGEGVVKAVGVGVNEVEACVRFAESCQIDCFLLAGRYTLLEQGGLDDLLPLAERQGFSFLLGGPFNSGILATGARAGAKFFYADAPADILDRTRRIERICADHGVPLATAALRFALRHPVVASVATGMVSPDEVARNVAAITAPVPASLWSDLASAGLLHPGTPV
jgi:D-threo-aldose 1-dehydrogenase